MAIVEPWPQKYGEYDHNENLIRTINPMFTSINPLPHNICFTCKGGYLCIDLDSWEVTYPKGITIPEATKILFDGLKQFK